MSTTASPPGASSTTLVRGLGLLAATAIVIGVVIGTGVFLKARVMTCNVGTPGLVLLAWVVAGGLSLAGALTYGELCARMPHAGGEYVFIREAYGRFWGFMFGWMRVFIGGTGSTAALAAGFAIFVNVLFGGALDASVMSFGGGWQLTGVQLASLAAIAVVTATNCTSVTIGGRIVSGLTTFKVALVAGVGVAALAFGRGDWAHFAQSGISGVCDGVPDAARGGIAGFGAAMMAALWAYNGWNEMTYVAGEVRNPQRNLPRALISGISIVAILYIFVNAAYFYVLAPADVANVNASSSVATEVMARFVGPAAVTLMAAAAAVSIFGALLTASLVGARVPYAMASDGLFFSALAKLSPRTAVPVRALLLQSAWTAALVLSGSFDALTDYAMFTIVIFWGMAIASVFVVRRRPDDETHYRTWGYPFVPALFLLLATWIVVNALFTAPRQALAGLGLIAIGVPFYLYWSRAARRGTPQAGQPQAHQE